MMIFKVFVEMNDCVIFEGFIGLMGFKLIENIFLINCVEFFLWMYKSYGFYSCEEICVYFGFKFCVVFGVLEIMLDVEVGMEFLCKVVLVYFGNVNIIEEQDGYKFCMFFFMICKFYVFVFGDCVVDNFDVLQNQEILLGGFFYG